MKNFERIFIGIALLSLVLKFFLITGGGILCFLSLITLSGFYFYLGFAFFNDLRINQIFKKESYLDIPRNRIFGGIISGISLSILLMGLLFKLMHWPGQAIYLYSGIISAFIAFTILMVSHGAIVNPFIKKILLRLITTWFIVLLFIIIPEIKIIKIQYKNYPKYIEAVEQYEANPTDENLKRRILEYDRIKMYDEQFEYYHHEKR